MNRILLTVRIDLYPLEMIVFCKNSSQICLELDVTIRDLYNGNLQFYKFGLIYFLIFSLFPCKTTVVCRFSKNFNVFVLFFQVITQSLLTSNRKHDCVSCSTGKFLVLLMILGVACLMLTRTSPAQSVDGLGKDIRNPEEGKVTVFGGSRLGRLLRRPPRLPPRLPPEDSKTGVSLNSEPKWIARQQSVKKAFSHAWLGYKKYAMGYDELMPLSHHGVDGLGGLGATIVDALDTAMIMGADEVVSEAGTWVETQLSSRISQKGQVNLFETTIRVLGGLLSAYHLSSVEAGTNTSSRGPNATVYLETAKNLADRLLSAFTSSPTSIPFSDVVLHDSSGHPAPGGLSSTSEVSTLQLEFNYLSTLSGDPKYTIAAMKVLEHFKTLPKTEGLVPIYIKYVPSIKYIVVLVIH